MVSNNLKQSDITHRVIPSVRGLIELCTTCLKCCLSHKKPSWPAHLNSLLFAYNAILNSTTGLHPYQLMFGCKAKTPCDIWLGLNNYDSHESVSKSSLICEHHKLIHAENQHALKNMQKCAEQSALRTEGKESSIPEGHNKIQNHFKDQEFVVMEQLGKPNVYHIKPVNDVGLKWIVNCRQLQDLQKAHNESDTTSDEEMGDIPSFNPRTQLKETPHNHKYATWEKRKPCNLVQSTIAGMGKDSSDGLSHHAQSVDHCPANAIVENTSLLEYLCGSLKNRIFMSISLNWQ